MKKTSITVVALALQIANLMASDTITATASQTIIYDPGSASYILGNTELYAAGPSFSAANPAWNQARAAIEFNIENQVQSNYVWLIGYSGGSLPAGIAVYGYVADGIIQPSDRNNTSRLLHSVTRTSSDVLRVDVSDFINENINAGNSYVGFLVVATTDSLAAMGFGGTIEVTDSLQAPSIVAETAIEVRWASDAGKTYQIQRTTDLTIGSWSNIQGEIPGTGESISRFFTTRVDEKQFFRVVVRRILP
jgi:hypothetical protein